MKVTWEISDISPGTEVITNSPSGTSLLDRVVEEQQKIMSDDEPRYMLVFNSNYFMGPYMTKNALVALLNKAQAKPAEYAQIHR